MHAHPSLAGADWAPHSSPILPAVLGLLLAANGAPAGVIDGHALTSFDARFDRFSSGYPNAPVPNNDPSFIGRNFNLSGIGWRADNPTASLTMVSERHFIGAAHVGYPNNGMVRFFDPVNNVVREYTVQNTRRPTTAYTDSQGQPQTLPADVMLGTLSAPIPAAHNITFYPVATGTDQQFAHQPLLNYGQNTAYGAGNQVHFGRNNVTRVVTGSFARDGNGDPVNEATRVAVYDFAPGTPSPADDGEFYLISGDSGGPSFIPVTNGLSLLGGHYGVSRATTTPVAGDESVDSFLAFYVNQLNAFMAQDTDATHPTGYSLTLVPVPEPGTFLLTGLTASAIAGVARRRARRETVA